MELSYLIALSAGTAEHGVDLDNLNKDLRLLLQPERKDRAKGSEQWTVRRRQSKKSREEKVRCRPEKTSLSLT